MTFPILAHSRPLYLTVTTLIALRCTICNWPISYRFQCSHFSLSPLSTPAIFLFENTVVSLSHILCLASHLIGGSIIPSVFAHFRLYRFSFPPNFCYAMAVLALDFTTLIGNRFPLAVVVWQKTPHHFVLEYSMLQFTTLSFSHY